MKTVGLIGAGTMGLISAEKIIEAGLKLIAFEPFEPSAAKVKKLGATLASSPAQVAQQCEIVLLFLPGPKVIEEVVTGTNGILSAIKKNSIIVDLSTTDPQSTRALAAQARKQHVGYLDAPVLGRPGSIGKWALPVGGDSVEIEKCRPVLNLLATQIIPIGESGSGNKIKLLNQLMFGAINAMTAEMMAISRKVGISPELLYNTITASQAGTVSNLFKELGQCIADDDYSNPAFSVDLLCKDVTLATQFAKNEGANPVLGEQISAINKMAQNQGYGKMDTSSMWKCYETIWKLQKSES
jgi:3-hydroxyisobutyrate dehydrogenase